MIPAPTPVLKCEISVTLGLITAEVDAHLGHALYRAFLTTHAHPIYSNMSNTPPETGTLLFRESGIARNTASSVSIRALSLSLLRFVLSRVAI